MSAMDDGRPRVAVTGAAGMFGTALVQRLSASGEVWATDHRPGLQGPRIHWRQADLTDVAAAQTWLREAAPDVVVHCAAIVDVDACERDPAAARALHVNATATLADAMDARGGTLVYISSDSVFDGTKPEPYTEDDAPAPLNVYALTKLQGELAAAGCGASLVLRTNIFGWNPGRRIGLAEWVVHGLEAGECLGMFGDVRFTPMHVAHLAEVVQACVVGDVHGLYHAAGGAQLSKYEFGLLVARTFRLPVGGLYKRTVAEAGLTAPRPRNMALDSGRLAKRLGRVLPSAEEGLVLMREQRDSGALAALSARLGVGTLPESV